MIFSNTVDQITADYTYKESLITPLAHLYGTFLDAFVIATIVNGNSEPVKVVVESEISGFTDAATDTITISGGGTKEVRQNPRLTTAAIDSLTSQKEADLHVTISYLDAGQRRGEMVRHCLCFAAQVSLQFVLGQLQSALKTSCPGLSACDRAPDGRLRLRSRSCLLSSPISSSFLCLYRF